MNKRITCLRLLIVLLCGAGGGIAWIATPLYAAPKKIDLLSLSEHCRTAILSRKPTYTDRIDGPNIHIDTLGDISVGWSSYLGIFFSNETQEASVAQGIYKDCPRVAIVVFSGPSGGSERWYMRRTGFSVRHSKDSGMPGDKSKYWKWDSMPFDYDPWMSY